MRNLGGSGFRTDPLDTSAAVDAVRMCIVT